ncbi:hypothetical protein [Lyngbya confervoides]|uniref:Transposase n=1 Tax=Lyngbya confervoides BDU141951 TaxID=1574623 RepID=A0ABD4T958_9CYAN|nr:hypothetical protein [Lyngbya confervoides]MCM1984979.1 hypothetical protein [Lyngbya confervoides BDU141951]
MENHYPVYSSKCGHPLTGKNEAAMRYRKAMKQWLSDRANSTIAKEDSSSGSKAVQTSHQLRKIEPALWLCTGMASPPPTDLIPN